MSETLKSAPLSLIEFSPQSTQSSEVQYAREALEDYRCCIRQLGPGDRTWAKTMNFTTSDGHLTGLLIHDWEEAAQKGVAVEVKVDSHARRVIEDKIDISPFYNSLRSSKVERVYYGQRKQILEHDIERMEKEGVSFEFTRPFRSDVSPTFLDRDHTKQWGVMGQGQQYVWMGGVNLIDSAFSYGDFMAKFQDPRIVDALYAIFNASDATQDLVIDPTPEHRLIVDAGKHTGHSTIYQQALDIITDPNIQALQLTSQFPLDPIILHNLKKRARQGVTVDVLFSHPNGFFNQGLGKALYRFNQWYAGKQSNLTVHHYKNGMHAKLLNAIDQNGQITSMFGSHNLFAPGPIFRTRELQMVSREQPLNTQLVDFFEKHLDNYWEGDAT